MKIKLKPSDIEKTATVCVYCFTERDVDNHLSCCGEGASHFESAYTTADGVYLESEVEIVQEVAQ